MAFRFPTLEQKGQATNLMTDEVHNEVWCRMDGLSDIEAMHGTFAIEWDGIYGKHWVSYESEEAMEEALNKYEVELFSTTMACYKELVEAKRKAKADHEAWIAKTRNNLGNLCPELLTLKIN